MSIKSWAIFLVLLVVWLTQAYFIQGHLHGVVDDAPFMRIPFALVFSGVAMLFEALVLTIFLNVAQAIGED